MDDIEEKATNEQKTRKSVDEEWADALGLEIDKNAQTPPPIIPPIPEQTEPEYKSQEPEYKAPEPPVYDAAMETREQMPPTFMIWAVLSTLCCCLPAGVIAIYFSAMVSSRYYMRDMEGAKRASHKAEVWIIASIVLGVVSNILYVPFVMMMGM